MINHQVRVNISQCLAFRFGELFIVALTRSYRFCPTVILEN